MPVVQELERRKWGVKKWTTQKGEQRGGNLFTKSSLFRLLTNIIYTGNISYKGTVYPGEHEGIVAPDLWQRVQDTLRHNGRSGCKEIRNKYGALLRGLLYCAPCGTAMVHSYTARKGKHYRYYVCLTAQQRGWASCPSKSLNACEIEAAVVDYIRGLGASPDVFSETASQVRVQSEKRLAELEAERRANERELKRLDARLRALVGDLPASGTDQRLVTDQMADLQDQIRSLEQRVTVIREETIAVQRETLEDEDLEKALAAFDPIWQSLSPREQARIFKALVERVAYDGRDGKVTVTFRSPGIKAVCLGQAALGKENRI
jgi:site-specific DNA recombinase